MSQRYTVSGNSACLEKCDKLKKKYGKVTVSMDLHTVDSPGLEEHITDAHIKFRLKI